MESNQTTYYKTPIGTAKITGNASGITAVTLTDEVFDTNTKTPEYLQNCVQQLDEYFSAQRKSFDVKLNPAGTTFQKQVWNELTKIPYGKTITYLAQAKKMGNPKAIRAIASANGKNPIWILIPCHRVIGSNGEMVGYAGGLWRKKWLLEHENPSPQQSLF